MKQRQSSNNVERPQVPFIERSSTILIERDNRFPSRGEFFKSQAQLDIVSSEEEMEVLRQDRTAVTTSVQTTRFRS